MEESKYTDVIDRYLRGEMSSDEEQAFLDQANHDEALAEELELCRDIQRGAEIHAARDLKSALQRHEQKTYKKRSPGSGWKVAASVVLLAAVGYIIFQMTGRDKNGIYDQYYTPYPNIVNPLDRSENTGTDDGFRLYEKGQYQDAIAQLSQKLESDADHAAVHFYLAQSYLALEGTPEAITHLQQVPKGSDFYEPASWYLALAWLKAGEQEKAREQLEKIAASGSSYASRASDILQEL